MPAPDKFIPLYGDEFLQAVEGQPDFVAMPYLRCIWYYWRHTHVAGLKDDDEFLRRLCRSEKDDWPTVKAFVFDNDKCFTMDEHGLWHQKRAYEEWEKARVLYDRACARTAAATKARLKIPKRKR